MLIDKADLRNDLESLGQQVSEYRGVLLNYMIDNNKGRVLDEKTVELISALRYRMCELEDSIEEARQSV